MNSLPEIILVIFATYGAVSCFFDLINFIKLPDKKIKEISKLINTNSYISSDSDSEVSSDSEIYKRVGPRKRQRISSKQKN